MSAQPQLAPLSLSKERSTSTEQPLITSQETIENSQQADIAQLAYALWQQRGCPTGSSEIDWLEAEQQLSRQNSSTQDQPLTRTAVSPL